MVGRTSKEVTGPERDTQLICKEEKRGKVENNMELPKKGGIG